MKIFEIDFSIRMATTKSEIELNGKVGNELVNQDLRSQILVDRTLAWLVLKKFSPMDQEMNNVFAKVCPLWKSLMTKRLMMEEIGDDIVEQRIERRNIRKARELLENLYQRYRVGLRVSRCYSGYQLFGIAWREQNRQLGKSLAMKDLGLAWRSLSMEDKQIWKDQAEYKKQNAREQEMIEISNKIKQNPEASRIRNRYIQDISKSKQRIMIIEQRMEQKYRHLTDPF